MSTKLYVFTVTYSNGLHKNVIAESYKIESDFVSFIDNVSTDCHAPLLSIAKSEIFTITLLGEADAIKS